jgi:hypothetical protein
MTDDKTSKTNDGMTGRLKKYAFLLPVIGLY